MQNARRLTGIVRDTNAWVSFVGHLWYVLQLLGVGGAVSGFLWLVLGTAFAWAVHYMNGVPWYVWTLCGLIFATFTMRFAVLLKQYWSMRGVKPFDLEEFADECLAYYRDFSEFMVNRQEARPVHPMREDSKDDMYRVWQENVNFSHRTNAQMMQRFAPRAFAIAHQLKSLGIPPPEMFHFSHGDHGGVGAYIGVVGQLLKKGQLEEARKLDPKSTWGANFY